MQLRLLLFSAFLIMMMGCTATQPVRWISTPEYEIDYDLAWDLTIMVIGEHFDIETAKKGTGYLRTKWKPVDFSGDTYNLSYEGDKIGVRFTCRVEERYPFQLKLKVERGFFRNGEWIPIWIEYSRETICLRCNASPEWIDERLEREIMRELSMKLSNQL